MTSRMHLLTRMALAGALVLAGCGGSDSTGTVTESFSILTGDAEFNAASAQASLVGSLLTIHAEGTSGNVTRVLTLTANTTTTGTLTVGATSGATVRYSEIPVGQTSGKEWLAAAGAGSGTFTITELTASRIVGTLSAVLPPVTTSGATADRSLTGGTFSLKVFH